MPIPETTHQIVALIVVVLPGIVYAAVRSATRGLSRHDRGISTRLLQATVVGVVLDSLYLLLLGDWMLRPILSTQEIIQNPPNPL